MTTTNALTHAIRHTRSHRHTAWWPAALITALLSAGGGLAFAACGPCSPCKGTCKAGQHCKAGCKAGCKPCGAKNPCAWKNPCSMKKSCAPKGCNPCAAVGKCGAKPNTPNKTFGKQRCCHVNRGEQRPKEVTDDRRYPDSRTENAER